MPRDGEALGKPRKDENGKNRIQFVDSRFTFSYQSFMFKQMDISYEKEM